MTFKIVGHLAQIIVDMEKFETQSENMKKLLKDFERFSESLVAKARNYYHQKDDCNHPTNELTNFFNNIIHDSNNTPENLKGYVQDLRKQIDKNLHKISVAPGQDGKWKTWGKDLYLEEKMFPALFPFGVGG